MGGPAALEVLRDSLNHGDTEIAAAAASAMGRSAARRELTDDDVRLLLAATQRPFPLPIAATYALAQLARAGRFGTGGATQSPEEARTALASQTRETLCALLTRREPHVRANVIVALATLGHERCGGQLTPGTWMSSPHPLPVRVAAARFLEGAARTHTEATQEWEAARATCLERELSDELARFCRSPDAAPTTMSTTRAVRTLAYAADERTLLVQRWVVLRFGDGSAFAAFTDLNGFLSLDAPPTASSRLELPESMPLER
jgi:hypothetical protein